MDKEIFLERARELQEKAVQNRRALHEIAEVGYDLESTVSFIKSKLRALGLSPRELGRCGVIADIGAGDDYILLRADTDALPIPERTGLPFCAKNGNMHACGHDMHAAMLLLAAELILENESLIPCRVRLMFQGAEELLGGAMDMLKSGLFDEGAPRAALMLHIIASPDVAPGIFAIPSGGIGAPAAAFFDIEIYGRGAHGATPELGVDAIGAAANAVLAIEGIMKDELAADSKGVVSVGSISGGTAHNAIAEFAQIRGSVRSYSEADTERLIERAFEAARLAAAARGAEIKGRVSVSCPTLLNDEKLSECILKFTSELFPDGFFAVPKGKRGGGSEDFSHISHRCPSLMIALSAYKKGTLHNAEAIFDEGVLWRGGALLAYAALRLPPLGATD